MALPPRGASSRSSLGTAWRSACSTDVASLPEAFWAPFAEVTEPTTVVERPRGLSGGWALRAGFLDVPRHVMSCDGWMCAYAGPFQIEESILVKDGRALVWALRWAARSADCHRAKRLFVVENFGVACCLARGRRAHSVFSSYVAGQRRFRSPRISGLW